MWPFSREPEKPDICGDFGPHDDEVIDKTLLPSAYEQMDRETKSEVFDKNYSDNCLRDVPETFTKKLVLTLKCKKCGRVKQLVQKNP